MGEGGWYAEQYTKQQMESSEAHYAKSNQEITTETRLSAEKEGNRLESR
jgi:hypothetical protein